ncbi:MAG: acyl carrier protein [Acidobacteria bacterium]|nr:acyl carrier protein [Acidobacteriota bacterium]
MSDERTIRDTETRVIRLIAETQKIPIESIGAQSTFEEMKFDSLDGINILFALENEFDINIPDDAAREIKSVPEMVAGIEKLLAAKG